jgi:hypothetical protein
MMKIMRAPIVFLAALVAPLAAAPAWADAIYKWVDEQGVMHYSNSRPADPSQKAEVVAEDRISTYQSPPAPTRTASQARDDYLARRVDMLERELASQGRTAGSYSDSDARGMQTAYEQCLADRRVDCDTGYGYGSPYVVYGAPLLPGRRFAGRGARFHPIRNITGLTAGNVVTFRTPMAPRTGRSFR